MIVQIYKCIFLSLVIILNLFVQHVEAQLVLDWSANYSSISDSSDISKDMVLDNYGNVYITGYSWSSLDQRDVCTIKYDSTGTEIWLSEFNQAPGAWDEGVTLNMDNIGDLYVGGFSKTFSNDFDYLIIKYDSSGRELWTTTYNSPFGGDDYLTSLAIDPLGNIFVTGYSADSSGKTDFATVKYNSLGQQLWVMRYDGDASGYDKAWALTVDSEGYVYVTGSSDNIPGATVEYDYQTIKYDSDGNQLWSATWDGFGSPQDNALGIVVDTEGFVYVTGTSNGDFTTIRYDSEGTQDWFQIYNGPAGLKDKAFAISLDPFGNVIVTGGSRGSDSTYDFATLKYTAGGTELWLRRYSGPGLFDDEAKSMALDITGNIYVSGYSWDRSCDFATVKYTSDGTEDWVVRYDGQDQDYDYPYTSAVDADGKIYISGFTTSIGTGIDMTTLRYSPAENDMNIELTYIAGSPIPPAGGDLIFDILIINDGITTLNFDAWLDISYQGSTPTTIIQRSFESFQPGWTIDRENMLYSIPPAYPAGSYLISGKIGRRPDEIWDQSNFPFIKSGEPLATGYEQNLSPDLKNPFNTHIDQSTVISDQDVKVYNSPNPFNAYTAINFVLPVSMMVELKIFDVNSRLIDTEFTSPRLYEPGLHSIKFDGTDFSSGIYFYILNVGKFSKMGKMVLIK